MNIDFKFLVKLTKRYCGVNPLKKTRKREFVDARAMMYMVLKRVHSCTYTNIAKMFKCNHATVLHSLRSFSYIYKSDSKFRERYDLISSAYVQCILDTTEVDNTNTEVNTVYAEVEKLRKEVDKYKDKLIRIEEFNSMINQLPKHKIDDIKKKLDIMIQVAKKDIKPRNQQAEIIQANVVAGV
jgi:chromosomal replication initiation ATPase DnaA